ncbi:kinesin-related protein 4 [Arachis ipaensis]|uniref:kinesin-related protein 4 n=1 Tax=Arachis ipaensis TaxID=130454 RepID=UPI000A2B281F|nr:kinesin-related protein 4 [Arachis ipaensis]
MPETRSKKKSSKAATPLPLPPPPSASERRNWGNVFNLMVKMVRNQQNQLQSISTQNKFLQDRWRIQNEAWQSDNRIHSDHISQMKGVLKFEEKKRLLEAHLLTWHCLTAEHMEDDLADFKALFENHSCKSAKGEVCSLDQGTVLKDADKRKKRNTDSEKENKSPGTNSVEEMSSLKIKDELRILKEEREKLVSEKKFVWNQYNIMEKEYCNKLSAKQAEVEKANEKVRALVEQLESENNKKDSTISQLVSKVASMEAETERLNQEISRLSSEMESVRKSRKDQVTPVLNRCTEGTKTCNSGTSKSGRHRNVSVKKEVSTPDAPPPSKLSGKGNTSLKRKESPVILTSVTPKLFSSSFKVPKLKSSAKV